jgi:hypothetical protein
MSKEPLDLAGAEIDWVLSACTLPSVDQLLRIAEFGALFSTGLRGLERVAPTRLLLRLDAATEASARELTVRETSCCSFFVFDFAAASDGQVLLDVVVPEAHVEVLDALAVRAATAAGLSW